jgi:hypothetical protein
MTRRARRTHSPVFQAKVAVSAIQTASATADQRPIARKNGRKPWERNTASNECFSGSSSWSFTLGRKTPSAAGVLEQRPSLTTRDRTEDGDQAQRE